MLRVNKLIPQGRGLAAVLLRRAPTLALDSAARRQLRFEAQDSSERSLAVALPEDTRLRGGDVLVAEDGSLVRIEAAPERVLVITACPEHGAPRDVALAAYRLGQRHVALQIEADRLLAAPDAALAQLLHGWHLIVAEATLPFEPDAEDAHAHGHHHHHDHGHDHHHGHG